jgi:hypothetical protein
MTQAMIAALAPPQSKSAECMPQDCRVQPQWQAHIAASTVCDEQAGLRVSEKLTVADFFDRPCDQVGIHLLLPLA